MVVARAPCLGCFREPTKTQVLALEDRIQVVLSMRLTRSWTPEVGILRPKIAAPLQDSSPQGTIKKLFGLAFTSCTLATFFLSGWPGTGSLQSNIHAYSMIAKIAIKHYNDDNDHNGDHRDHAR